MAKNSHNVLPDDQLHVPKGFVSATNDTVLTKNASGNLEWMSPIFESRMFLRVSGAMGNKTNQNMYAPNYGGNTQHTWDSVFANPSLSGDETLNQSMFFASSHGYIKSFTGFTAGTNNRSYKINVLKGTPVSGSGGITWTVLGFSTTTGVGNTTPLSFVTADMGLGVAEFDSGDMLAVTIQPTSSASTNARITGTMEIVLFD